MPAPYSIGKRKVSIRTTASSTRVPKPRNFSKENPVSFSSTLFRNRAGSFVLALAALGAAAPAFAATDTLVKPATLIVDHSLPKAQVAAQVLAARRYDTF